MTAPWMPPLPEPNQAERYLCAKCGWYGASGSYAHPNDDGATCGHFPQVLGPWFTADQMRRAQADAARAALERAIQACEAEYTIEGIAQRCADAIRMLAREVQHD